MRTREKWTDTAWIKTIQSLCLLQWSVTDLPHTTIQNTTCPVAGSFGQVGGCTGRHKHHCMLTQTYLVRHDRCAEVSMQGNYTCMFVQPAADHALIARPEQLQRTMPHETSDANAQSGHTVQITNTNTINSPWAGGQHSPQCTSHELPLPHMLLAGQSQTWAYSLLAATDRPGVGVHGSNTPPCWLPLHLACIHPAAKSYCYTLMMTTPSQSAHHIVRLLRVLLHILDFQGM